MFKKNYFLLISVFLHLMVLFVVAQSVMSPSVPNLPPKKPDIIQATLIFDFPPKAPEIPVEIIEEDAPQPVEPEEALPAVETPPDSQIESISEPENQTPQIPPQSQALAPKPLEQLQREIQDKVPQEPEKNDDVNDIITTEQSMVLNPNSESSEIRAPATSLARRHLNSFQQQQRNKVAKQASRYYQQHKNSPVIDDDVKNPFMSEDEKLRDTLNVRADCSSTGKKTAAVILSFLGGHIDCSKPPAVNNFIQDRINKDTLLPGKYRQEDQKRPQSIVIKKE